MGRFRNLSQKPKSTTQESSDRNISDVEKYGRKNDGLIRPERNTSIGPKAPVQWEV